MTNIINFVADNLESIWTLIVSSWLLSSFILVSLLALVIDLVRNSYKK